MTLDDLADIELNMDPEHEWKRKCAMFVTETAPEGWWESHEEWLYVLDQTEEWHGDEGVMRRSQRKGGGYTFAALRRDGSRMGEHPGKGRRAWKHYVLAVTAAVVVERGESVCG